MSSRAEFIEPTHRTVAAPRRLGRRLARQPLFVALTLIAPALALRLFTSLWPFLDTAKLSLYRSNPSLGADVYIGFDNYRRILSNPVVRDTIFYTLLYTALSTVLELVLGIGISLMLNTDSRIRHIARPLNLIPWAVPVVVTGIAFRFAFDGDFGQFSDLFRRITGQRVDWLIEIWPARLAVIATNVWRNAPFVAVIILAALQTIPDELYEAARIDGANPIQLFWAITLPLITPVVISVGIFFLIWQISTFDLVLAMTGGGPGNATQVLGYRAYLSAFQGLNFGSAAALGMLLMAGVAIFGLLGMGILRWAERKL